MINFSLILKKFVSKWEKMIIKKLLFKKWMTEKNVVEIDYKKHVNKKL